MTLKLYLVGIIFTTVLALGAFFLILGFFSPEGADIFLFALLFFSLFIGLAGFFSLVGFFVRKNRFKEHNPFKFLSISFRQGILLSLLFVVSLILRTFFDFWWWGSLILLILILVVEFLSLRQR